MCIVIRVGIIHLSLAACLIINLSFPEEKTIFTKPLTEQTVVEKQTATFECEVSKPKKVVKWYRNGKEISKTDKRYEIIVNGCKHMLKVKNCALEDTDAEFTAKVEDAETSAPLKVEGV